MKTKEYEADCTVGMFRPWCRWDEACASPEDPRTKIAHLGAPCWVEVVDPALPSCLVIVWEPL